MVVSGNAARQDGHSPRACVLGCRMQATSQKLSLPGDGSSSTGSTARCWPEADRLDGVVIPCSGRRSGIWFLTAWHRIGEMPQQQRRRCDEKTREGLVGAN